MKTTSLKASFVIMGLLYFLTVTSGFITSKILTEYLAPEELGLYGINFRLASIAAAIALIVMPIIWAKYAYLAFHNKSSFHQFLIGAAKRQIVYYLISITVAIVPYYYFYQDKDELQIVVVIIISLVLVSTKSMDSILKGMQEIKVAAQNNAFFLFVRPVIIFIGFILIVESLKSLYISLTIIYILFLFAAIFVTHRTLNRIKEKNSSVSRHEHWEDDDAKKFSNDMLLNGIFAVFIWEGLDLLIIPLLIENSGRELGFYTLALSMVAILVSVSRNMLQVLFPKFSQQVRDGDKSIVEQQVLKITILFCKIAAAIVSVLYTFSEQIFTMLFNKDYLLSYHYFDLLLISSFFGIVNTVIPPYLLSIGQSKFYRNVAIIATLVYIPAIFMVSLLSGSVILTILSTVVIQSLIALIAVYKFSKLVKSFEIYKALFLTIIGLSIIVFAQYFFDTLLYTVFLLAIYIVILLNSSFNTLKNRKILNA